MKFPKRIAVKIEQPGTNDEYLGTEAESDIHKMVNVNEECDIGIYELIGVKRIKGVVVEMKEKK